MVVMADAKLRLVDAAERLFGERGIDAVSLRQVAAAAGQRNNAAAHYHFGTKAALIDAVFDRRMAEVNERRLALLGDLVAAGRDADVRSLVEAFVLPFFGVVGPTTTYARFCAQVLSSAAITDLGTFDRPVMASLREVFDRLDGALAPDPLRAERLHLLGVLVVHALAARERAMAAGQPVADDATALEALLQAAVSVVSPTPRTSEEPHPC
jgi:AcrR family transcriptional regulator